MATFKSYCIDTDGRPERSKFGGNFEMVRPECEDGPCRIVIKVWRAQQSGMEPISIADIPEHRCVVTGKFDDDADFDRVMSLIDAVMKESGTSDGWFFGPAPVATQQILGTRGMRRRPELSASIIAAASSQPGCLP